MNEKIKSVLEKIEKNGFEAYIVGGFVRDHILGISTSDVDICTNALPKDLATIFPQAKISDEGYGAVRLNGSKYTFDITTYREEIKYIGRKPAQINYVNNLMTDIKRRDFTINSLCMNQFGVIIDLLNATTDIKNKIIRVIGRPDEKFREDPLRILRALRLSIILNFTIEKDTLKKLKKNLKLIKNLSYKRKLDEMTIILNSPNAIRGLRLLKHLNVLKHLELDFSSNIRYVDDILGMWSQIKFSPNYPFSKNELKSIENIRNIVKYGKIDNNILFKYGLYESMVAGTILGENKESINLKFNELPIRTLKDIEISSEEIIKILNIKPSVIIKEIFEDLKIGIFNGKVINENQNLKIYIDNNRGKWCKNEKRGRNNT